MLVDRGQNTSHITHTSCRGRQHYRSAWGEERELLWPAEPRCEAARCGFLDVMKLRPTAERHRDVSSRFLLCLFITPENAGSSRDLSQMSSDEELMEPRGNRSDLRRNAGCLLCSHRRLGHIFCRPARNDRLICVRRAERAAETQLAHVSPRIRRVALLSYLWQCRTSRRTAPAKSL